MKRQVSYNIKKRNYGISNLITIITTGCPVRGNRAWLTPFCNDTSFKILFPPKCCNCYPISNGVLYMNHLCIQHSRGSNP